MADLQRALAFLQSGTFGGEMDYDWREYYDRIVLDNPDTDYPLFASVEGKGLGDTNWSIANQMDNNQRMAVMYLGFYYIPAEARTQAELISILKSFRQGVFKLKLGNKDNVIELPLHAAFSASAVIPVIGGAVGDQITGRSIMHGSYELGIEVGIAAGCKIKCSIDFDEAPAGGLDDDRIYAHMVGPTWNMK